MEVIQWTSLWEFYRNEYENEKLLGGALGAKTEEDLKLRIIEHVLLSLVNVYLIILLYTCLLNLNSCSLEYLGCLQVLFKDYPQEDCGPSLPEFAGLHFFTFVRYCIWSRYQVWRLVFINVPMHDS